MKAEVNFEEGKRYKIKWGTNIKGEALYEDAKLEKIGPGGIHYFDNSMCFGIHELEKLEAVCIETELSGKLKHYANDIVDELRKTLKTMNEEEHLLILQDVLKQMNIGVHVDATCNGEGAYQGFNIDTVNLIQMKQSYKECNNLDAKYMQTDQAFCNFK